MAYATQKKQGDELNRLYQEDLPVHEWYRFVLSYPPHLVRQYVEKFSLGVDQHILDPFCGTGTTLVEAKKLGIHSSGIEANAVAHFAAAVKTCWDVDLHDLVGFVRGTCQRVVDDPDFLEIDYGPLFRSAVATESVHLRTLEPEQQRLLIKNSISPLPLHKTLILLEAIEANKDQQLVNYGKLALAKQAVYAISNLRFGPEVGVGKIKEDAPVLELWKSGMEAMINDLSIVQQVPGVKSDVYHADARQVNGVIEPNSIDAVITSPPYPNEKDYSRTTRLEAVLLGFLSNRQDLRQLKQQLIRSNTRGVYKCDEDDDWIVNNEQVVNLANAIEDRRLELGKTSGFERLYARVVRLYFGGMARHLDELKPLLKSGAKLAYVVGDQASYFRIKIHTGQILAEIAESLGYRVLDIDLFRTRFSTTTKEDLREEVVLLEWNR